MDAYKVLAEGWLEDARGNGALRKKDERVLLTADQAAYLVASEQVEKIPQNLDTHVEAVGPEVEADEPVAVPAAKPGKKPD